MREIKFRAWDKANKRMLYRGIYDRNWYATERNDKEGCHCVDGIHPEDKYNLELMQYTGLKDSTEKEIYEGDIIYNQNSFNCVCGSGEFTDQSPTKRFVIFDQKDVQFKLDFVDENMRGSGASGYSFCKSNQGIFEIIGNIHENPELLS